MHVTKDGKRLGTDNNFPNIKQSEKCHCNLFSSFNILWFNFSQFPALSAVQPRVRAGSRGVACAF